MILISLRFNTKKIIISEIIMARIRKNHNRPKEQERRRRAHQRSLWGEERKLEEREKARLRMAELRRSKTSLWGEERKVAERVKARLRMRKRRAEVRMSKTPVAVVEPTPKPPQTTPPPVAATLEPEPSRPTSKPKGMPKPMPDLNPKDVVRKVNSRKAVKFIIKPPKIKRGPVDFSKFAIVRQH